MLLELTSDKRTLLERWARRPESALQSRIVLRCADGLSNKEVATREGVSQPTVGKYSSWINQVERWFAYLTADLLQRGDHRSVQALEHEIRSWIADSNRNPKPFIWTKTAEDILESLGRLLKRINGARH